MTSNSSSTANKNLTSEFDTRRDRSRDGDKGTSTNFENYRKRLYS